MSCVARSRGMRCCRLRLAQLAVDDSDKVRGAVASNPRTPQPVLAAMTRDVLWVREMLAGNEALAVNVMVSLADDPAETVRFGVASSPDVPVDVLIRLAGDPAAIVRGAVALNDSTPPGTLLGLAGDDSGQVRRMVGMNPKTPIGVLTQLAADPDGFVNDSARTTLASLG